MKTTKFTEYLRKSIYKAGKFHLKPFDYVERRKFEILAYKRTLFAQWHECGYYKYFHAVQLNQYMFCRSKHKYFDSGIMLNRLADMRAI